MNATELSRRLGEQAEAVCRRYLSNGRKEGRYWLVGDVDNAPGRSLYVRLVDGEKGPAGKWTDAATGDHGDLLDIIGRSVRAAGMRETLSEARRFLSLSETPVPVSRSRPSGLSGSSSGHRDAALRLWSGSCSIAGTLAQAYLQSRGLEAGADLTPLQFLPGCHYRPSRDDAPGTPTRWPALIAAVTDNAGGITGVHRTWLDPSGKDKAPVAHPRKTMGAILGHAVRFGVPTDRMIIGEGIETMLSLRACLPAMPLAACTSSAHLAAFLFPAGVNRLYPRTIAPGSGLKLAGLCVTIVTCFIVWRLAVRGIEDLRAHKFAALFSVVTGLMGWPVWSVGLLPSVNGAVLDTQRTVSMRLERTEVTSKSRSRDQYHWAWLSADTPDAPISAGRYFIPQNTYREWSRRRPQQVKVTVARGLLGAMVVTGYR